MLDQYQPLILIIYTLAAIYTIVDLVKYRHQLAQEPLTNFQRDLAVRIAFLLLIPVGIFIHELGHAFTVILLGGRVAEFNYFLFFGSVLPVGNFTLEGRWLISTMGTVGSLSFGILFWLITRKSSIMFWRYVGRQHLLIEILYSLIYYPLFTLFTGIGDWRRIYNFAATPILSLVTFLIHFVILLMLFILQKKKWFESA